jgi:hypothetical protein
MADSELLLQPEMLAELKRYRALERRLQASHQQCQEFQALAKQVTPGAKALDTLSGVPLESSTSGGVGSDIEFSQSPRSVGGYGKRNGSLAAELDATHYALKQQIETLYQIEAQFNERLSASHKSPHNTQPYPSLQLQLSLIRENTKIALCAIGGVVLFVLLLILLYGVMH